MRKIVVGSRKSALALTQTKQVIESLERICRREGWDVAFEIKHIVTKGDRVLDVTLNKAGGKGLFVKEIEAALLDGSVDLAVHSMKDVPAEMPEGLVIGAVPPREDARDVLVSREGRKLEELPPGAKLGTSSLRRACQLKQCRPDLTIEWIRGNIDTRLKKLETEGFDAIVLAAAGLKRMGWEGRAAEFLPVSVCLPAVGQGALCIQCREDDQEVLRLLQMINDPKTETAVAAERSFLRKLNGGCQIPIAAHAQWKHEEGAEPSLVLDGMVGSPDGTEVLRDAAAGSDPVLLGERLADMLIARGAERILNELRH